MSASRPRLFVSDGILPRDRPLAESLRSAFDVVEVESVEEAERRAADDPASLVLRPSGAIDAGASTIAGGLPPGLLLALEHIGEGVGLIDAAGTLTWANRRLSEYEVAIQEQFVEACREARNQFDQSGAAAVPLSARPARKFTFGVADHHYEVLVSIADVDETPDRPVRAVVGILWEVTASRVLQNKIDAIDAAGSELMRIDAATIEKLNMAERLALLEEKIIRYVRELLNFDKFEVRLVDRESNQLELVINRGLTPLRIGEAIYVGETESGISGYVAATGECYNCRDVEKDPLYRSGLADAKSSLTVPLRLYDRILGVFNIESSKKNAFSDDDRRFAQIFARYIAMAMHILDLLVVERCTTNEQVAANVLGELAQPLEDITVRAGQLRQRLIGEGGNEKADAATIEEVNAIVQAAEGMRRRIEVCAAGPKSLLGAEQELLRIEVDPVMAGKHVILADNEPSVREAISNLLTQKGCRVTVCSGGAETIDLVRERTAENRAFDLVISDIKMPDRNGYEVFRTVKECSSETPVILITGFGYDPHHSIVRASQEGLHSFLFKPLQASLLLEAVTKAFSGEAS